MTENVDDLAQEPIDDDQALAGLDAGFALYPNFLRKSSLSTYACMTYLALCTFAFGGRATCYPGNEALAEVIHCHPGRVKAYIHELSEQGLITVRRRGLGKTNAYTLLLRLTGAGRKDPQVVLSVGDAEGIVDPRRKRLWILHGGDLRSQKEEKRIRKEKKKSGWLVGATPALFSTTTSTTPYGLIQQEKTIPPGRGRGRGREDNPVPDQAVSDPSLTEMSGLLRSAGIANAEQLARTYREKYPEASVGAVKAHIQEVFSYSTVDNPQALLVWRLRSGYPDPSFRPDLDEEAEDASF